MTRNESLFLNPETFDPERYMNITDPAQKRAMDPRRWIFGFGRRICPGMSLAETAVWNLTAGIIATLEVKGDTRESVTYDHSIFRYVKAPPI
jgi:cytochrome P450